MRQQATTESNVVTYEVVISAPNNDLKLKPGLTANVTIFTLELNDVLAVSSKALRFTPNEAMLNEGETITDVQSAHKLWVKEGPNIKAVAVETGMTNGTLTQITRGASAGLEVLTDVQSGGEPETQEQAENPFMPRPRNNKNNDKNKK